MLLSSMVGNQLMMYFNSVINIFGTLQISCQIKLKLLRRVRTFLLIKKPQAEIHTGCNLLVSYFKKT